MTAYRVIACSVRIAEYNTHIKSTPNILRDVSPQAFQLLRNKFGQRARSNWCEKDVGDRTQMGQILDLLTGGDPVMQVDVDFQSTSIFYRFLWCYGSYWTVPD